MFYTYNFFSFHSQKSTSAPNRQKLRLSSCGTTPSCMISATGSTVTRSTRPTWRKSWLNWFKSSPGRSTLGIRCTGGSSLKPAGSLPAGGLRWCSRQWSHWWHRIYCEFSCECHQHLKDIFLIFFGSDWHGLVLGLYMWLWCCDFFLSMDIDLYRVVAV